VAAGRNTADGGGGNCTYTAQLSGGLFSSGYTTGGSQGFAVRSSSPIVVTSAGNRTLTFTNTTGSGDNTCYIDSVAITSTPLVPTATIAAATAVTGTGATLNGTVNPNGAATTVVFQYGTTTAFGSSIAASQSPVSGVGSTAVSAILEGLTPDTIYHYRISATNSAGGTYSNGGTFTTPDTLPPILGPVAISSSGNPGWARLGQTVTLNFTASEPIQTPSVTLLGAAATVANPSGNNWTATATVGAGTAEGPATFSISAVDSAGNAAAPVSTTTDFSSVTVDKTAPTLTPPADIVEGANSTAGAVVYFTTGASDNLDPTPMLLTAPASGSVFPIGVTTVDLTLTDAAGNASTGGFTVTVQDRTSAPVFNTAGAVPLAASGFDATGFTVGPVTLGFDPAPGQVLTLVDNTSENPITGAFTNLADSGTIATGFGGRSLLFIANYSGGDGNDLTLTLLNPEIVVEQPSSSDIAAGGSRSFGTMVVGNPVSLEFTLKNTGPGILNGMTVTKSGSDQNDFTVTTAPAAPLAGPSGTTTFTVLFNPITSGAKTANIHIASDDADENHFDIHLTGQALAAGDDTDADGMNDAAEFLLSSLGYDWQIGQPALVSTLMSHANVAGLFNASQVRALHAGTPLISKNPATGRFKLTMDWKKSTDLSAFLDFPAPAGSSVSISPQGDIEFEFPSSDNAAFFRIEME
jgi:hypothetical protein